MGRWKYTLLLWVLFSLGIIVTIASVTTAQQPRPVLNLSCPGCPGVNLSCPSCSCPSCYCHEPEPLPLFMREAKAVAEAHDWGRNEYRCGDFAIELFKRLQADGYDDVRICFGDWYNGDKPDPETDYRHNWVKIGTIPIEATTGEIIEPEDYEMEYNEKWCKPYIPVELLNWVDSYKDSVDSY